MGNLFSKSKWLSARAARISFNPLKHQEQLGKNSFSVREEQCGKIKKFRLYQSIFIELSVGYIQTACSQTKCSGVF
jgi:hypothetical protein